MTPQYKIVIRDEVNGDFEMPDDLGAWVKSERERANKSLQEVAAAVDVSRQAVFFWEHGRTQPSMPTLWKLVSYFRSCSKPERDDSKANE